MIESKTNPRELVAESWEDLQNFLFEEKNESIDRYRTNYVFRGVYKESYKLQPSLQRMGRIPSQVEKHLLKNFAKYSSSGLENTGENIWNLMALGQHYGLPTRLLDWSFSPYVALHFMADYDKDPKFEEDGAIWMIDFVEARKILNDNLRDHLYQEDHLTFMPQELNDLVGSDIKMINDYLSRNKDCIIFIEAPSIDNRIINQFALFSSMLNPDSNITDYLDEHPEIYKKVIVPAELKWEIRDKLDQANISERTIYPGLSGVSSWLKRWYSEKNLSKHWKP